MQIQFSIPQSAIKAVAYAMGVKDIRYYLNGMLMQHNGQETRLVATDGSRLHACIVKHKDAELLPEVIEAIIPDSLVKTILKAKARCRGTWGIQITIDGTRIQADLFDGTSASATAIDGKFPDYQRVIPTEFSGVVAQYNPEYLVDAELGAQAWLESGKATPCFCHNGDSAGGIALDGFVAIVMPRRADATLSAPDAAFKLYPAKAEPQAIAEEQQSCN